LARRAKRSRITDTEYAAQNADMRKIRIFRGLSAVCLAVAVLTVAVVSLTLYDVKPPDLSVGI
jgi:hypothetical protein